MNGDFVIFKKDLTLKGQNGEPDETVFKKGHKYEILDENAEFIFVNTKPGTNECSQIPKTEEQKLYKHI